MMSLYPVLISIAYAVFSFVFAGEKSACLPTLKVCFTESTHFSPTEAAYVSSSLTTRPAPDDYQMCVHIFGAKCSPTCAEYALRRCALDQADQTTPEVVEAILRSFYVDDLLHSCRTEDDAIQQATHLIRVFQLRGFRLTQWSSSSRRVLGALSNSELAKKDINLDLDEMLVERALGQRWDTENDELIF